MEPKVTTALGQGRVDGSSCFLGLSSGSQMRCANKSGSFCSAGPARGSEQQEAGLPAAWMLVHLQHSPGGDRQALSSGRGHRGKQRVLQWWSSQARLV